MPPNFEIMGSSWKGAEKEGYIAVFVGRPLAAAAQRKLFFAKSDVETYSAASYFNAFHFGR